MKRFTLVLAGLTLAACQETTSPPATPPATSSEIPDLGIAGIGLASATAPHLWAVVNSNGSLARGSGVLAVERFGPGRYEVRFNVSVRNCLYVATTRPTSGRPDALLVYTASGHVDYNGVYVETRTQGNEVSGNALIDGNFNLVVACGGPSNLRGAVINYFGTLSRASKGTTVTRPGPGRFYVRFASPVSACAFIATVGDPGRGRAAMKAVALTASRAFDSYTVYVETRKLTGGLRSGVPFHLVLVCPATPESRFAVVRGSVGTSQRASAATSSWRSSVPGRFYVGSDRELLTCAAVATRGSVVTEPFPVATLEVRPGVSARTIGFLVRKPSYNGGAGTYLDFHAAIFC